MELAGLKQRAPFPRSKAFRVIRSHMRTIVQPPPSSHCKQCGGDLRLKLIEAADRGLDLLKPFIRGFLPIQQTHFWS